MSGKLELAQLATQTDLPASTSPGSEIEDPLTKTLTTSLAAPLPQATNKPSWIEETMAATNADRRLQPWRAIVGEEVDYRLDDGQDLVRIEKNVGGKCDPDCPFRTQGSSLAA